MSSHPPQQEAVEQHPEQTHPLGVAHERPAEERRAVSILSICLVVGLFLIPFIAVVGDFPLENVFVGLLPFFVTVILDIVATASHYKKIVYWGILLVVHILGLGVVYFLTFLLSTPLGSVSGAVGFSLVLSTVTTLLAWFAGVGGTQKHEENSHVVEFNPEKLAEYVQSIEDKAKGINFAIGRVYRSSNGGSAQIRARLRVDREWYNEFYSIKGEDLEEGDKEKTDKAIVLLHKIRDRLKLLAKRENEVFNKEEFGRLKNLARNPKGEDAIIDVLKTNDNDPVEHYYVSALDFCERILEELEK